MEQTDSLAPLGGVEVDELERQTVDIGVESRNLEVPEYFRFYCFTHGSPNGHNGTQEL